MILLVEHKTKRWTNDIYTRHIVLNRIEFLSCKILQQVVELQNDIKLGRTWKHKLHYIQWDFYHDLTKINKF